MEFGNNSSMETVELFSTLRLFKIKAGNCNSLIHNRLF